MCRVTAGARHPPYDRRPPHEPRRRKWINHFFFQNKRYPRASKSSSHRTNPHRGRKITDFNFKTKDIRERLRVRATARTLTEEEKIKVKNSLRKRMNVPCSGGSKPRPTADHCNSHSVGSGLIIFPSKTKDIRRRLRVRATARTLTEELG